MSSVASPHAAMGARAPATGVAMGRLVDAGHRGNGDPPLLQVPCLTAGLPTPDSIAQQKEGYARALEEQLRKGVELLGQTHKQKTDNLHQSANKNKQQYDLMLDQQVKQQEMSLSQQYNQQLMMLQQAAQQQRAELEQQAAALILEWQQRQTQREFIKESAGIQKRFAQMQRELAVELDKVGSASTKGAGSMQLSIGAGSCGLSTASSMCLPIGVAPVAKYELPATLRIASGSRLPGILPSRYTASTSAGSCTLPPAGCSSGSSFAPGVYSVPRPTLSRPGSYVPPPALTGSIRSLSTDSLASRPGSFVPAPQRGPVVYGGPGGSLSVPLGGVLRGGSAALPVGGGGSMQLSVGGGSTALPSSSVSVYTAPATTAMLAPSSGGSHALPIGGAQLYAQAITQAAVAQAAAAKAAAAACATPRTGPRGSTSPAECEEPGPKTPLAPARGG